MPQTLDHLMHDKPLNLPGVRPDNHDLKPLPQLILDRRATQSFLPDPVPPEYLEAILHLAAQAPSGYNLQPWRFIVVQNAANKQRLQKAARNQGKISEAPVVIITIGLKQESRDSIRDVLEEGARRGAGNPAEIDQRAKGAVELLDRITMPVWVSRHVMVAFTTMMLAAKAYGFDTAPMEGFDPDAVRREFDIPADAEVIALLALGKRRGPDKVYPGRYGLDHLVSRERYGQPWHPAED
ncbi:MAG TPA: nitroreductase family protein [Phycisphaerae bacterium]|nr:nitroreductase family protein [Phycisphaerae bacterium]